MIILNNIKKTYNEKIILDINKIELEENKIYVVIGENGSGKSTFAKILASLIDTDDKKNISSEISAQFKNEGQLYNKYNLIGYLSQKPYVFDMSLEKNILFNADKNLDRELKKQKLNTLITDFGIDYLKNKNAKKFSGGEKQKLSLARFMMREYKISIFDEVTSAMDSAAILNAEKNMIKYFNGEYDTNPIKNKIFIFITHSIEQAKRMTNDILMVENKNIVKYY